MFAKNGKELLEICIENNWKLSEYAINYEITNNGLSRETIIENMYKALAVMKECSEVGQETEVFSTAGHYGGDAFKVRQYLNKGKTICGDTMVSAIARAISTSEVNSAMGKIVACPTAGSCGIVPAAILSVADKFNLTDEQLVDGLFTASAIGLMIGQNATFAGAEGGCQAECGSAASMASGAIVEMLGGTPKMALDASAIVIKNILGLVCDPVAGVVVSPCVKRNFAGAVNALTTADLVLAGVESRIPFDEMVETMFKVGKTLPMELRETALGGIAITKTGLKMKKEIFGDE